MGCEAIRLQEGFAFSSQIAVIVVTCTLQLNKTRDISSEWLPKLFLVNIYQKRNLTYDKGVLQSFDWNQVLQ